jgi:hypothetical protein
MRGKGLPRGSRRARELIEAKQFDLAKGEPA